MKAAIYARVSTADQNSELRLREIRDYADRQDWEIVQSYQETISGAKAGSPGLNQLMVDVIVGTAELTLLYCPLRLRQKRRMTAPGPPMFRRPYGNSSAIQTAPY